MIFGTIVITIILMIVFCLFIKTISELRNEIEHYKEQSSAYSEKLFIEYNKNNSIKKDVEDAIDYIETEITYRQKKYGERSIGKKMCLRKVVSIHEKNWRNQR